MPPVPSRRAAALSDLARSGPWSPQTVELLTRLWTAGDLSASQIARRLGVTRNAVLGKVHRLGLSGKRPAPVRTPRPAGATARRPRRPPTRRALPRLPAPPRALEEPVMAESPSSPDIGAVAHLEDLGPLMCCWPCGDPKAEDFAFCGGPAEHGPYCVGHARRAYRPGGKTSLAALLRLAARAGA